MGDLRTLDLPVSNSISAAMASACTNSPAVSTITKSSRTGRRNRSLSRILLSRTFSLAETEPMIRRLAEKLWSASRKESRIARTVVLKLKTSEFKILTRSHTPAPPIILRRVDGHRAEAARTGGPRAPATLSACGRWVEQLSGTKGTPCSAGSFRMRMHLGSCGRSVGYCRIISSIPFFISFAVGSALWVPTIQA